MSSKVAGRSVVSVLILATFAVALPVAAQDVTRPAPVEQLRIDRSGGNAELSWDAVILDAAGQPESIDHYNVYRGTSPDFVPDKIGFSNRIGTAASAQFSDPGAAADGNDYFYLTSAVDTAGNESDTRTPLVVTPPLLSGFWTNTTIEVDWTVADPVDDVVAYRVYYGRGSGQYEFVQDVGLDTTLSLTGLQFLVNWYVAVTAVDINGNESVFSNEHIDPVGGRVALRAQDDDALCWTGAACPPAPGRIQRNNGWQILAPADFPEGDWTSVNVTFTMASNLCTPPAQGTLTKCGSGNPCPVGPCNGGYNPCGDPWDRLAHLFLVLDDCVAEGGSCKTNNNLELIRAITPFGTDANPPDGTGFVPPRRLTMDITPYVPLLTGTRYVGAEIVNFTQAGWHVTVDFLFSKRPQDVSPKPPADGIEIVGFSNAPLPTHTVSVPPSATDVKMRVFTTGHGGSSFCTGGADDGLPCTGGCPGGACNPCDEFCMRTNTMLADGQPIWDVVPWRTDCSPAGTPCSQWNACGTPSCTFPRAGWCPGYIACWDNAPCDNDVDMTGSLLPGGTYDIDYTITPQNGSWPVSVVFYWYD